MRKNISFIILIIGVFMAALDNGIISAALTTINSSFNVSAAAGTWGITLYTLGLAIMTPIVGKLSDRYGRKKLFLIEIVIFTIGSLAVALSPNFTFFLVARVIQSFGGGGIFIIASSHVIATYAKEKQGRLIGLLGGMNGIAAVIGPNIGSFLMDITGTWHWLFLINVPIGILLVVGGFFYMEESKDSLMSKIDFIGITLLTFSILSVMLAVNNLSTGHFFDSIYNWSVLGLLILSIFIFVAFIIVEKRNEKVNTDPILPYSLLRKSTYSVTMVMAFLSGVFIGSVVFIPSFAEQVLGIAATKSGYWMTPLALASGIGAGAGGFIVDKRGPIKALVISGITALIGFGGLAFLTNTKGSFIIFSIMAGIGFGFVLGAPLTVLTSNAAGRQKGSALGTLSVARQIGLTISPVIFGTFIQRSFNNLERIIPEKLEAHNVDLSNIPESEIERLSTMSYADIQSNIDQIPVENVRLALQEAFNKAAHNAYEPIYLTSAIAAILIIILAIMFNKKFKLDDINERNIEKY